MTEKLLIEVEPSVPRWVELKEEHGICTVEGMLEEKSRWLSDWMAFDFSVLEDDLLPDWAACDQGDVLDDYTAEIIERGGMYDGCDSERDAVIGLIRKRQLEGWEDAHR